MRMHMHVRPDRAGEGIFACVQCGNRLFRLRERFPIGTVLQIFWVPVSPESVHVREDVIDRISRSHVTCGRCEAHLGYRFEDGRPPTGNRFFIEPAAIVIGAEQRSIPVACRKPPSVAGLPG